MAEVAPIRIRNITFTPLGNGYEVYEKVADPGFRF